MIPFLKDETEWSISGYANSDVSELYWNSNILACEIANAYGFEEHPSKIVLAAGSAILNPLECPECSKPYVVRSRSQVAEMARAKRRSDRYRKRYPHLASSEEKWSPYACDECKGALRAAQEAAHFPIRQAQLARERELRTMPYADYLKTPEWAEKRHQALRRARNACQACAGSGCLHVHHRTYVRRGAEWVADLIVLCAPCHELFHERRELADGGRSPLSSHPRPTEPTERMAAE